jgi:transcriptional regulator with XRE-family HTH domain
MPPKREPGNKDLGDMMRKLRIARGIKKQEVVAQKMHIRRQTLSYFEKGITRPTPSQMEAFRVAVGLEQHEQAWETLQRIYYGISVYPVPDTLETRYIDRLYALGSQYAACIRLFGAAHEYYQREHVSVMYDRQSYDLPDELLVQKPTIIKRRREEAQTLGINFHDGPCARLLNFRVSPKDADPSERKHAELKLGPLGYHDYYVANNRFARALRRGTVSEIAEYVDLDKVAIDGNVRDIRLSNLLDTLTTPVTLDGQLIYCPQRSEQVSADPGLIDSGVDEMVQRLMDQPIEPGSGYRLSDIKPYEVDNGVLHPRQAPDPFQTVLRGIEEELSGGVCSLVHPDAIYMLGLCLNLDEFHPDLLFLVALPLTFDEVLRVRRETLGHDFFETSGIAAVPCEKGNAELDALLAQPKWMPSAKASVIRSVEFLEALKRREGRNVQDIITSLAHSNVPS